jgi:hypothetical protein
LAATAASRQPPASAVVRALNGYYWRPPAQYASAVLQSLVRPFSIALCFALAPLSALAIPEFRMPPAGSPERRAIMDSIRPQVEAAYQQKVKFFVRALASNASIALVFVVPLDDAGNVIGERTIKGKRGEAIALDGWVFAIVKKESKVWRAVEIDMLDSVDGLTMWPSKYPEIPGRVFDGVGVATNADG